MGNFVIESAKRLCKSPGPLLLFERYDEGRILAFLSRIEQEILVHLPDEVEIKHKVTAAIKHIRETLKLIKKAEKKEYKLMFAAELQEQNLDKALVEFLNALDNATITDQGIRKKIASILEKIEEDELLEEKDDRAHYQQLEALMVSANKDRLTFRQQISNASKTLGNEGFLKRLGERATIRGQSREIRNAITGIKVYTKRIKSSEGIRVARAKDAKILDSAINAEANLRIAIIDMKFVMKRDFLWNTQTLQLLFELEDFINHATTQSFLPKNVIPLVSREVEVIGKGVSDHCHTISGGFRRIISSVRAIVNKAEQVKAKKKAA